MLVLHQYLQADKEKSQATLQAKLAARRERRAAAEKARLAKELQQKSDEKTKQDLQHRQLEGEDLANQWVFSCLSGNLFVIQKFGASVYNELSFKLHVYAWARVPEAWTKNS